MKTQKTNIEYGDTVRRIIKNSGDTFKAAAQKLGITTSAMNYVLIGQHRFGLENLIRFCEIYDASLDDLHFHNANALTPRDFDVLAQILDTIDAWAQKQRVRIETRDKIVIAFTFFETVKTDPTKQRIDQVTDLLMFLIKTDRLQKSA